MSGTALIAGLGDGSSSRVPYLPVIGSLAWVLGQIEENAFTSDAQAHAVAAAQAAAALHADAVTIGYRTDAATGSDAVSRVRPLCGDRAVIGCLDAADVGSVRAYCEAGVDLLVLLGPDRERAARFRTVGKTCGFYSIPAVLVDRDLPDAAAVAADLGLHGAVVAHPRGDEPGIVGGGLDGGRLEDPPPQPRQDRFFYSFASEVPADATPEALAALGMTLTARASADAG